MTTRTTRTFAALGLATLTLLAARHAPAADRPQAPPEPPLKGLEREVKKDADWLKTAKVTADRYTRDINAKKGDVKTQENAVSAKKTAAATAERGWNTRVNPTCESGQTFAACTCQRGKAGKARKKDEIRRANKEVTTAETELKKVKNQLTDLKAKEAGLKGEKKAMDQKLAADRQRLEDAKKAGTVPRLKVPDELPLGKPTKPGKTPDALPFGRP